MTRLSATPAKPTGPTRRPRVLVVPRLGDPLWTVGRARLIWAANTAQAYGQLGYDACLLGLHTDQRALAGDSPGEPFSLSAPPDELCRFYGVEGRHFRILTPHARWWRDLGRWRLGRAARWRVQRFLPDELLAHLDIVHTRDFHLASHAVERGLEVIYEDHNEPQNQSFLHADRSCFFAPNFRLAVASTERVRDRLIRWGAPLAKTAVGHSGLNAASLQEVPEERQTAIRAEFLGQHCTHLLAYAGGLHSWRGIRHLRQFAQEHPHCAILVLGGSAPLSRQLRKRAAREGLRNFHVLGYRPQQEVPLYLQAADALLLPYRDPHEAFVTSPLKFFEYLASGRPIAAARLPELAPFARQPDLAIEWCGIDDYAGFAEAVERALATPAEALPTHCRRHRELAHGFVWEERQRALCAAAGLPFLGRHATAGEVDEAPCAPFSHRRDAGRFSDAHSS